MASWYYLDGGQQQGPVDDVTFRDLIASGRIGPDDLVWSEGMSDWQAARHVPGLQWPTVPVVSAPPSPPGVSSSFAGAGTVRTAPPSYLPWAIIATLFCCMPAGIVSIVYASKSISANSAGDYEGAVQASEKARLWLIVSVVLSLGLVVFAFLGAFLEG